MITYDKMIELCEQGDCSRYFGGYNPKTCIREYKRKSCYDKLLEKENKKEKINDSSEIFRKEVWLHYYKCSPKDNVVNWELFCMLWKILTSDEKNFVKDRYADDLYLQSNIDVAHIVAKSQSKSERYEIDNVILMGRYFHRLLTDMKHPVNRSNISSDVMLNWHIASKTGNREGIELY
jgi:hypothetical protein